MALFSRWKIFRPCDVALGEPTKRAPIEQIDNKISAFSEDGRNEGACIKGKIGLNLIK